MSHTAAAARNVAIIRKTEELTEAPNGEDDGVDVQQGLRHFFREPENLQMHREEAALFLRHGLAGHSDTLQSARRMISWTSAVIPPPKSNGGSPVCSGRRAAEFERPQMAESCPSQTVAMWVFRRIVTGHFGNVTAHSGAT